MYQKYFVRLSSEERAVLEKLVSSGHAPARKLRRANILLKSDCSEGGPNWTFEAICTEFDVNPLTVMNVRKAFVEGGLERALNRKKPDRVYGHCLDGKAEALLISLACSAAPEGHKRWTLRLLRDRLVKMKAVARVSHETIRSTLKKTNLRLG